MTASSILARRDTNTGGNESMKITIIIEHANEHPANEVKPVVVETQRFGHPNIVVEKRQERPSLNDMGSEYTFRKLSEFYPTKSGYIGNTNAAKTYKQGRKTHQCSNCGASNRRMSNKDGYCHDCRPRTEGL